MEDSFVFKYGKHAGKTFGWLKENAPSYLAWCKENAPNMLKVPKPKAEPKPLIKTDKCPVFRDKAPQAITPNLNFWNEGPHEFSKPYLEKMGQLKINETPSPIEKSSTEDEWNF